MGRFGIFLLFAIAALAHASVPSNENEQGAIKVPLLRQNRLGLDSIKGKNLCKECEKIVSTLKKIVDNPQTEQELIDTLKTVCDIPVLGHYKDRCMNMVTNIVAIVHEMQWLLDDPTALCETIKFCKSEAPGVSSISKHLVLSIASKIVQDIHEPSAAFKIDTCSMCTAALNEFKRLLETPELMMKIQNGIEQLCKYTGTYQTECNQAVEAYFPKILQIIVDALCQPEQTCAAIKLCKRATLTNFAPIAKPHLDKFLTNVTNMRTIQGINIGCLACEAAVKQILQKLSQQKVLATIISDISNFACKILPKTLQPGCFDFLGIYGVAALQLTLSEVTPKEICQDLHACTPSFLQQIEMLPSIEKSVPVCDACKMLSKVLSVELLQPNIQQDVINVLTRGCLLIPGELANKCGDLVIEYVPAGLSYVADFFTRDDACSVLRLC
jgi:hypothetical protein